ncbi:MAG: bifunctional glutamate N-acetyltransferase/amino-acid acetyltransferase ArgJ, partial [Planctomycetota bacterium]|nr:bifunctional glutamate N-acetyltransferase/amino-acid acetyltransferase ArgJ [Planctomycetota bacterium]
AAQRLPGAVPGAKADGGSLVLPTGFRGAAVDADLAKGSRLDLALIVSDAAGMAGAMFTRNRVVAAPVALSREHLRQTSGMTRAILINAGCANACTGPGGDEDAMQCAQWVADAVGCDVLEVLVFSTGVIGEKLQMANIERAVPDLCAQLDTGASTVDAASRAILTTDTRPKVIERAIPLQDGGTAQLVGFAKGSGMIHPDMATMLAFLLTDLDHADPSHVYLRGAVMESFHRVTVDGDSSTNDAVLLWSSGTKQQPADDKGFFKALSECTLHLAKEIARDGEGATKLVEVEVRGGETHDHADNCARAIAQSLLVKTAVHGCDPNWGRILAAAGRSGAEIDTHKVKVGIGEAVLFENDEPQPANEAAAAEHLKSDSVRIWVDLATGPCDSRYWTCDLSADYVRINADYRT